MGRSPVAGRSDVDRSRSPGRSARVDRARRAHRPGPVDRPGLHGLAPGAAAPRGGAGAEQRLDAVDRGHLRFVIAGMLIPMGALGDRIGRRRLLLIGSILFALASLPTAYATSPAMVIATRA